MEKLYEFCQQSRFKVSASDSMRLSVPLLLETIMGKCEPGRTPSQGE